MRLGFVRHPRWFESRSADTTSVVKYDVLNRAGMPAAHDLRRGLELRVGVVAKKLSRKAQLGETRRSQL